ncbi:deoxyribose-phosphate aldolase [Sulfidibacter corallicola]|uniref:Deoxyribose-phosphate aldolase n=1 Tax=Sulfidibacter corallicola TaxID=2818388 RepID=A0A8A4TUA7_SULCO|nr:deoxyribose-phosphate aldolase [Sulfidibacter corallicola]QTD52691.1 deoxyribose-phosphate aldolase [Sulfidibacter corallicola]
MSPSNASEITLKKNRYAQMIDHTLLKPMATPSQIRNLCEEAVAHQFFSVCVNPAYVPLCADILRGQSVRVCTVVGFPLGATGTAVKAAEAAWAVEHGATEIDMVINQGWAKARDWRAVEIDIAEVRRACGSALLKVILETCNLTDEEKIAACKASESAGAHFVKTSTGFGGGGATLDDVRLMRESVSKSVSVKASGGIRDLKTMEAMIEAGAGRIGASAGIHILSELRKKPDTN